MSAPNNRDVLLPFIRMTIVTERYRDWDGARQRSLEDVMLEAERRGIDPRRPFWMTYDRTLAVAEFQQEAP